MLAISDPRAAYLQSDFDARLKGSRPQDIVLFCLGEVVASLGAVILAEERRDPAARSKALTRGVTALTALEIGVDRDAPIAESLLQFFGSAKSVLLDSVRRIDVEKIETLRADVVEIRNALAMASA